MLQSTSLPPGQQPRSLGEADGETLAPPILLQYWRVILRWKWVIAGIVASCLALGLIWTLLQTPQYTAVARVDISRDQKKVTNVEGLEAADAGKDLEFYETQYSLLKARSLAERVSRGLKLSRNSAFFDAHGEDIEGQLLASDGIAANAAKREKAAVDLLLKHIAIQPIRGSALVDIGYSSGDAVLSAEIANAWTQQFIAQSMDRKFASTSDARRFLEVRLADLKGKLENSERDLVRYAQDTGIVALEKTKSADGRTTVDRTLASSDLEALNEALIKVRAERIAAESEMRQGSAKRSAESDFSASANDVLRQKRAEVAAEYAKLMVQFEPGYPAARALAEQMRVLDNSIAAEERRTRGQMARDDMRIRAESDARYRAAVQQENELAARVEQLKLRLTGQQRDSIQYNIYQREADTNRELYDGLLQRYKEIGVAGVGSNNIAIVDIAKVPERPSSPRLPLNMALALVLGLGLAGVSTFALDQIDEGLRDPNQVYNLLQLPLLGSVPDAEEGDVLSQLRDTKSSLSEAYLSVRSNLAFSTDHGVPRSIMVTSTRPGEGKSTTSFALAAVLARTGKKVLLVDADMRSPSMHGFNGVPNRSGLSNLLAGEQDWQRQVLATDIKGMSLIPAGPLPPNAAELLSSDRMLMLVRQILDNYDHLVIDSPPILGLADAPLLSRAVEGSVFVAEAEGVAIRGIRASLGRLKSVQAQVFGLVLTKYHQNQAGFGYGYGYDYGYGDNAKSPAGSSVD